MMKKQLFSAYLILLLSACGGGGDAENKEQPTPTLSQYTLSITSASGAVTSNPAGINCGSSCAMDFEENTSVTLTAVPETGYEFSSWSGDCSGADTCSVAMTAAKNVTATFTEIVEVTQFELSVTSANGTVSSTPAGIDCGSDCSESYDEDTEVTLTQAAASGYEFSAWTGACTGSTTCSVTMDAAKNVTATFTEIVVTPPTEYTLTVVSANGTVSSTPAGIDCGSDCSESYAEDTVVALTQTAASGYEFSAWTGACTGSTTCSVTMDAAKNVTATFTEVVASTVFVENYTVVLKEPTVLPKIGGNASGVLWHPVLEQYLVVKNEASKFWRYDSEFESKSKVSVVNTQDDANSDIDEDTEGLAYIGDSKIVVVTEENYAHIFTIGADNLPLPNTYATVPSFQLLAPPSTSNKGFEGVAVRLATDDEPARIYACQEGTTPPDNDVAMKVVYFDLPVTTPTTLLSYADSSLTVEEPFDADALFASYIDDCAGMTYDARTGHLLILSEQSSKILQVSPEDGHVHSWLSLSGVTPPTDKRLQFEGITLGPNNEIVLVSEQDWVYVLQQPE